MVSWNEFGDPGNPLQGLLGDLLKMIGGAQGGAPWFDAARSLAQGVATDGQSEPNADPLQRIKLEELTRVAELHVAEATGLPTASGAHAVSVSPVGRGAYALRALDAWRPILEEMVAARETPAAPLWNTTSPAEMNPAGLGELLGQFAVTMGPLLLGMQFGSAAGHLAHRALGQYAVTVPWPSSDDLLIVPDNVSTFATDWSLPTDETMLWVCIRELTVHSVLLRPHVRSRLSELLRAAALQVVAVQQGLAERLGGQGGDPEMLQNLLSDPESLLADLLAPGERSTSHQLTALVTALGGYVDHVTAGIASHLIGSARPLTEAWYRFRSEDGKGEQAAGALFGIELGHEQVDRGASFVRGVIERAGEDGLRRLWAEARNLPTPAEVDAPGLWLQRIDLPDLDLPESPPA